jgi:hypothetical protein
VLIFVWFKEIHNKRQGKEGNGNPTFLCVDILESNRQTEMVSKKKFQIFGTLVYM